MMTIKFYNTLSKSIETFQPLNPDHVTLYVCGPTVYDRVHLGNARPLVVFDVLYRMLSRIYPKVTYVRNITDVDDKINQRAREQKISIYQLTEATINCFEQDVKRLCSLPPSLQPKATDHIDEMIDMIQQLIANNHAYISDGHVLFDVTTLPTYGKLSGHNLEQMVAGSRVEIAQYKKNPHDFVLWKPSSENDPYWASPWGDGRPGWHIECSAMSKKYLGNSFDIHGGGRDLIFPHHENEIAQNIGCHGKNSSAKYWMHNEMLTVNGEKMSKSLGNFITVQQALERNDGELIRFYLLSTHYRKPLDWNDAGLAQAVSILNKFYDALDGYEEYDTPVSIPESVIDALHSDLNIPLAITCLHTIVQSINKSHSTDEKKLLQSQLKIAGGILGILQQEPQKWFSQQCTAQPRTAQQLTDALSDQQIESYIAQRFQAKLDKNYGAADEIRIILENAGVALFDSPVGTTWKRR